jgi:hypothetical protein
VTLTREEEYLVIEEHDIVTCVLLVELPLGGWSRLKRNREIDTKIASYLNDHSWYRNTLMPSEKRK